MRAVPSLDVVTSWRESGLNTAVWTAPVWPRSITPRRVVELQTATLASSELARAYGRYDASADD